MVWSIIVDFYSLSKTKEYLDKRIENTNDFKIMNIDDLDIHEYDKQIVD